MKTKLINGNQLTEKQIAMLPYNGAKGPNRLEWIECHSFYFTEDGNSLSPNPNEYYPVVRSLKFLPY